MEDSITRFPKYQKIKKERTGHLFILQTPIPMNKRIITKEKKVLGGLNNDFETKKSWSRLSREGCGKINKVK
jgi:hypothetical protein